MRHTIGGYEREEWVTMDRVESIPQKIFDRIEEGLALLSPRVIQQRAG